MFKVLFRYLCFMNKDTTPHDTLFKHTFSHKEAVEGFLRNRLPQELADRLDFTTLTKKPDSFLPSDYLGNKNADVLWAVHTKAGKEIDFLLHFEGEGTPQQMAMRVLGYQVKIGEAFIRENPGKTLPTVITFVVYYGTRPWIGAKSIAEAYKDFASQIQYGFQTKFVIDLGKESSEEIMNDGEIASAELVFAGRAKGKMLQVLCQSLGINQGVCCERAILNYYFLANEGKEQSIFKEIRKFDPDKADHYSTMFDNLKDRFLHQGMQQGIRQGMQELLDALKKEGIDSQALQRAAIKVKKRRAQQ